MHLKSASSIYRVSLLALILVVSLVPPIQGSPYWINVTAWDQESLVYLRVKFWHGGTIVWNPEKQIKELVDAIGPFETSSDGTPTVIGPFDPCVDVSIAFEVNPQLEPVCRIECILNVMPDSVIYSVMGGALVDENPPEQEFVPVKVYCMHNSEDVDASVEAAYGRAGPKIDKVRFQVVREPDPKLTALQTCVSDVWSCLNAFCSREALVFECPSEMRTGDIEKLASEDFTITDDPSFHINFLGLNIRPDQSYRRPNVTFWPLADVNFRHALVHCYDQETIIALIHQYTATPVRSLVPPGHGGWAIGRAWTRYLTEDAAAGQRQVNVSDAASFFEGQFVKISDHNSLEYNFVDSIDTYTNTLTMLFTLANTYTVAALGKVTGYSSQPPAHPYNPGNPFTSIPGDGTSCGILMAAGYTFVDADATGTVTPADYWLMPNEAPVPDLLVFTPPYEVYPTQAEHVARFIWDLAEIGLAGTTENGWSGLIHHQAEYEEYLQSVYQDADFDIYMAGLTLGRFPDHLYAMCHSSQDCQIHPWKFNAPGIHDPELDEKLEILKFSVHGEGLLACHGVQGELYDENWADCAFAYIPMYSRVYFSAFKPGLKGIVRSPGYGSDNMWTYLNTHWEPGHPNERIEDGKSTVNWILGEVPERLNPLYGYTAEAWEIMARTMDSLIEPNPYTHEDKPWIARDWKIEKWATEDDVNMLLTNTITMTNESLGFGDGETSTFKLNNCYVVPSSEIVLLNNTVTTEYTLDYTAGEITFDTAPSETTWINAYYSYEYLHGYQCKGSHWHEDWPQWSRDWHMTSWTDTDSSGTLSMLDLVNFGGDPNVYAIMDMTWDIKVENKSAPYNEMKLSGSDALLPRPPTVITPVMMPTSIWHEEWPTRSTMWTVTGFTDNGDGILSRSDQLNLTDGTTESEYHVDSVTITLHLEGYPYGFKVMEFAGTGMKVLFWLREDVFWQDGRPYTAEDARFNWLFLRDNQIPRYQSMWEHIVDVEAVTNHKVVVYLDVTSQFLPYDLACTGAMLPPPVWKPLDGLPLEDILAYDPATDTTPPVHAGPWFGWREPATGQPLGAVTCLYGTGPFIFDFYDPVGMFAEAHAWRCYWKMTDEVQEQKVEMFHRCGDVNYDGLIWAQDLSQMGIRFGTMQDIDPEYDPDVDVNSDGIIDIEDVSVCAFHFGNQREWPDP